MVASEAGRNVLVVSAHSADFVWRAAGAIALSTQRGDIVTVVCLSYGEKGESQGLWSQPGMTLAEVKQIREKEAREAAAVLGAEIVFYDMGDYPLLYAQEAADRLVADMRRLNPAVILTHVERDPYNFDHCFAHEFVLRCRMVAQAAGHPSEYPPIGAPQVLCFEPHQSEQCQFVPNLLLDITGVFDTKERAMQIMGAQSHLVGYYTDLAARRGLQYRRNGGRSPGAHVEAFQRVFPTVQESLS